MVVGIVFLLFVLAGTRGVVFNRGLVYRCGFCFVGYGGAVFRIDELFVAGQGDIGRGFEELFPEL